MNKHLVALGNALLFTASLPVLAASTTELTVTGVITPSACTPTLPGAVDYGKISVQDLQADRYTNLERRTLQLSVNCDAATLFAISPIDNRAGSAIHSFAFGLGLINENQKLGRYHLTFGNPAADTPSTLLTRDEVNNRWYRLFDDDAVRPNDLVALGSLTDSGWIPHPLQNATMDITLHTAIAATNTLTLTSEVALDGSATMEVKYL